MIKKLRMKLIAASMISLLIVLLIIEGIIGVVNYKKIVTEADRVLEVLDENGGMLPKMDLYPKKDNNMPRRKVHQLSYEFPYESRYFSVVMDEEGEVISSDTGKITIVDSDTAIEYAKTIWDKGKKKGFIENYRYVVSESESESNIRIIFLDCGRSLSTFYGFIITGIAVSLIGLVSVFILMIFVSAYIVKPFSENYEKQKRFITDAGHELKTPLTIIDADTEVLEMDIGENEWLCDIQTQTKRMADLTNNLIFLSRMEEECKKEFMIEFSLSELVEETVGTFQSLIKTQNKTLNCNIKPLVVMKGDEKAIRQLVVILLDNAVKYSDKEGRIEVTLEKQKNRIRLSVFNTTEQITREHLDHLFDRFYRTDGSRNSQTGGYGLGLSIAAATVNAHKGKIIALSEDEKSLRIVTTFPS